MSATIQKKTYTVTLTADKEEGGFVGLCNELHAHSEGDTYGETVENMREAVELAANVMYNVDAFNILIVEK